MDLALYARVIWRFRLIVFLGLLLAIVLSLLSFVRVSFKNGSPSLTYRQATTWQSTTRLLITGGSGFPQGRTVGSAADASGADTPTVDFAGLAVFYAQLANGDAVQRVLKRDRSLGGTMVAQYDVDSNTDNPLPILLIGGFARTPEMAMRVAQRGADAFRAYLKSRQDQDRTPASERVKLSVLSAAAGAVPIIKRKKTVPIVVFLTVMIAAIGLAFVFENLRPRIRLVESRPEDVERPRARDSA
jgi:hypothetical protein